MNRLFTGLTFFLLLFLYTAVFAAAAVSDGTNTISITALDGVSPQSVTEIQHAADLTTEFFTERTGIQLAEPVAILLTPDRASYISAVIDRFHINELQAEKVARGSDALSGNHQTVVNVAGIPTIRQKTFLIAHELTHHYQRQLAGSKADGIMWLLEGTAETVGAQTVAAQGYFTLRQYHSNWQNGLKAIYHKPSLSQLETRAGWSQSIITYGSTATYKTAGLAVLLLTEKFGIEKVLDYFRSLGLGETPDSAFQQAFGISISHYKEEYLDTLRLSPRKAS